MALDLKYVREQFPTLEKDWSWRENAGGSQILKGAGCFINFGTPEGVVSGSAPDSFMRVVTKSGNVTAICRLTQTSGPALTRAYTLRTGFCTTGAGSTNDVQIGANPSGMIMLVCKIKGNA